MKRLPLESAAKLCAWKNSRALCPACPPIEDTTSKVVKYDLEGHYLYSWGSLNDFPGSFLNPHGFSVDQTESPAVFASSSWYSDTMKSLRRSGTSTAARTAFTCSSAPSKNVGSVRIEMAAAPAAA